MTKASSSKHLLAELKNIAEGLGKTFAPFCEVVVHDLTHPKNAILAIENNLSGRRVGQPATELGLARIQDPGYPAVITNYANQFADGRKVKSTSVGIRNEDGDYVAAICLNVDLTLFNGFQAAMSQFTAIESSAVTEHWTRPTPTAYASASTNSPPRGPPPRARSSLQTGSNW
jgi:predicted transcriptional regulator YheO